jgi:hypothetical protein
VGLLVGRYTIFLIKKPLLVFVDFGDKFLNKYLVLLLSVVLFFILFSLYLTGGLILWYIISGRAIELGKFIYLFGWVVGASFLGFHPENNNFK